MTKVSDIFQFLNCFCPVETQLSFDNAGLILGNGDDEVSTVVISLDVTSDVISEAIGLGAGLIISHHPVIWDATKKLVYSNADHRKYIELIKHDISVISMHTNLDKALGGVNDVLLDTLGADYASVLDDDDCIGRIGMLREGELPLSDFLSKCKIALNTRGLRYYDAGRTVNKLAVLGGSGGYALEIAYNKGCDTFVSADLKYDVFLKAKELGINLIDADHFCTENPVVFTLQDMLSRRFPLVNFRVSGVHGQTVSFF